MAAMSEASTAANVCPRCGLAVPPGAAACPNCGLFVHLGELQQISHDAMQLEPSDPQGAAAIWQRSLGLLPADSPQYQMIRNRIGALSGGFAPPHTAAQAPPRSREPDAISTALFKTIGSMLISIVVYAYYFQDWRFAAGFVLLILVHEMGHVIANKYYGLSASPPIFIPFVGAVINLRQRPENAKVEGIVGIAGPVAGTVGAIVCYALYLQTRMPFLLIAAYAGFLMNLFNLLPIPPLDGGRVTAAVSPWIWMLGLVGLVAKFLYDWQAGQHDYILILVLFYAFPRIKATLKGRERFSEYYNISRAASWSIGTVYVALGVVLIFLFMQTGRMAGL
jgi:Zn-dependent protease